MELSDTSLLTACRQGDPAAWELLVNRFRRLVYTIPRRAGLDAEQAADVFQRVFLLLVEHLDHLEHPDRIAAWLATTAKHETWRVARRAATARAHAAPGTDDVYTTDAHDQALLPDQVVVQVEEQSLVKHAVERLDKRCQRLLELLFYRAEPASYVDVASELGIAEGSIGPIRARCLERLRGHLQSAGF